MHTLASRTRPDTTSLPGPATTIPRRPPARPGAALHRAALLQVQATAGNRAAQTLVARQPNPSPAGTTTAATFVHAPVPASGQRLCFPPSAGVGFQEASGFGTLAERFIEQDYCATMGCLPGVTDYVDNFNPTAYVAFLRSHNPSLAAHPILTALASVQRPDLLTDKGPRKEYYEIKPFSPSGVGDGMSKLLAIMAYMGAAGLPYVPGVVYSPSKDISMMSGLVLGEPLTVSLNVQRPLPGLLVYSLCLQGNLATLLAKITLAALIALILAELIVAAGAGALVLA